MGIINLEDWPRRSHYLFFRQVRDPHFSVTANLDATALMERARPAGVPIFNRVLFSLLDAANAVPEFRTRFRGGTVTLYDAVHTSITVPIDGDRFAFCDIHHSPQWAIFDKRCRAAIDMAKQQRTLSSAVVGQDDWIYMSCLPWLHFTAMTNAKDGADDCIPRFAWGRIDETGSGWRVPVSIEAHHALVDGFHVSKVLEGAEQRLNDTSFL